MLSIFYEETRVSSGVSPEYFQQISLGTFKKSFRNSRFCYKNWSLRGNQNAALKTNKQNIQTKKTKTLILIINSKHLVLCSYPLSHPNSRSAEDAVEMFPCSVPTSRELEKGASCRGVQQTLCSYSKFKY